MGGLVRAEEWAPRGVDSLERNAEEVVRSSANVCVTAGPGAGKTELLAQRACFLLETGACPHPRRILAISFKRDAAKNIHERVMKRAGATLGERFDSHTFDAFAKGILDQFRAALPQHLRPTQEYELLLRGMPREDIEEILLGMRPPPELGSRDELREFADRSFFESEVPKARLRSAPDSLRAWAAREFWRVLLHEGKRSQLSFAMVMRLARELIRGDARLRRAYRSAYSHVFIDEFQDTTSLQYCLVCSLFKGTDAVITAVGDPRQRIMGWAGAMSTVVDTFKRDFGAAEVVLHSNHRASAQIAPVVRFVAQQLKPADGCTPDGSGTSESVAPPVEACAAHRFPNEQQEAEWIADEIARLLRDGGVSPRDIGVLVRMRADEYAARVIEELRGRGLSARLEDKMQDLLTEPIVGACCLGLRALAGDQPRRFWGEFRELVADCRSVDVDDRRNWTRMEAELEAARLKLRALHPDPDDEPAKVRDVITAYVEPFVAQLRSRHGQYRRGSYYDENITRLAEGIARASALKTWQARIDEVEGVGSVPVLTIHKSKGLEYHSVFFVGLEDGAFWNFRSNREEECNAFFVALSRAKQRVVFTLSDSRVRRGRREVQRVENVRELFDFMKGAKVQMVQHT